MIYAGIGARFTPPGVCNHMFGFGRAFARMGFTLRSGHARGADNAFEAGCDAGKGTKEIFLKEHACGKPHWFDHAAKFHPAWESCDVDTSLLHARNSAIMLGEQLNKPVDFVVCWTVGGRIRGGTGQALRIAEAYRIPVFNLWNGCGALDNWILQTCRGMA